MASNGRNLANLLGDNEKITKESMSSDVPLGTEDYSTVNDLPATNNQVGDQVYIEETNRLYIWTGTSWYNIALINQTPTWDSGGLPEAAYDLDSIGGSATSIQLSATDPDGIPVQWTYSITDSGNDLATVSNDSNGTFTITAKSLADILSAGYDSSGGTFDVTFRASDGVNLATALSEFTISFTSIPSSFPGSNYGYATGGSAPPPYSPYKNTIDKFPFAADANATDVGDLTQARNRVAGHSSSDYGYTSGGKYQPFTPPIGQQNIIDKFPFATDANATDVGDLTSGRYYQIGQSSSEYGYSSGTAGIDKFPFATDANATDIGDLIVSVLGPAGQSSGGYGYTSGGGFPTTFDVIQKFPFATDANSTDVGDITVARRYAAGQSSSDYGYSSGGSPGAPSLALTNVIDKFPFSSDANATDVGDIISERTNVAGQSSTEYGYTSGGSVTNVIEKFPFTTDGNSTDVGDLTLGRSSLAGQQY